MRQHTFFGKGVPDITPSALNQHYVDLYTREVYLSRGTQTPADWGTPLIDSDALDKAIRGALQNLQLPDSATVKIIQTTRPTGEMPLAAVDPTVNNGRFIVISNAHALDPTLPENYLILNLASSGVLLANSEMVVHNGSPLKMRVRAEDNVRLTLARNGNYIVPYGTVRLKLLSPGGGSQSAQWLISGDTASDVANSGQEEELNLILQSLAEAIQTSVTDIQNG